MSTNTTLSKHVDVVELATKIGQDIGGVAKLQTTNKTSLVAAINELKTANNSFTSTYAKKTDLTPLATKAEVSKDIGVLTNLQTTNKTSLVAAINEVSSGVSTAFSELENAIDSSYAKKSDLTSLATKSELSKQIADLIGGADADNDTLKEIADRVTALAQADTGLVSVASKQAFNEAQKQQARDNIGAISEANVTDILESQSGGDYVSAYLQASK